MKQTEGESVKGLPKSTFGAFTVGFFIGAGVMCVIWIGILIAIE